MKGVDPASAANPPLSPPLAGYSYIHQLVRDHNNRKTQCVLLVALASITMWGFGLFVAQFVLGVLEAGVAGLWGNAPHSDPDIVLNGLYFGPFFGLTLAAHLVSYAFPLLTVAISLMVYDRTYKRVRRDLISTPMSLMLIDDQFSAAIETARSLRYRPRLVPVTPGNTIVQRIRHFSVYYSVYYSMCYSPAEPQVPNVVGNNCWFDGIALWIANTACCLPVSFWFLIRTMVLWPRILAIHKCVLDFLQGRFDYELEQLSAR